MAHLSLVVWSQLARRREISFNRPGQFFLMTTGTIQKKAQVHVDVSKTDFHKAKMMLIMQERMLNKPKRMLM